MTAAQTCSRSGAFRSYVRSIETADAAEAARRAAARAARQQRQVAVAAARQAKREAKTPAEKQHAASQIRRAGGLTPRGFLSGLLGVLIFAGIITGIVFIVIAIVKSDKPGPAPAVPSWALSGAGLQMPTGELWLKILLDMTPQRQPITYRLHGACSLATMRIRPLLISPPTTPAAGPVHTALAWLGCLIQCYKPSPATLTVSLHQHHQGVRKTRS